MNQIITCVSVGVYKDALTRGRLYELLAHDVKKNQVRVRGDNARTRWFSEACFDLSGGPAPVLTEWRFNDPVQDSLNGWDETNNYVDVSFELSDGTTRWCSLVTPEYLKQLLSSRSDPSDWGGAYEPAIWGKHILVIRDLATETVDWLLRYLDQPGELIDHSLPVPFPPDKMDDYEEP